MDNIKYTLVNFDKTLGQLLVRFEDWHDTPVDIPLTSDGLFITGDALDQHIRMYYPSTAIARKKQLLAGIANADAIESLIDTSAVDSSASPAPILDLFSILK